MYKLVFLLLGLVLFQSCVGTSDTITERKGSISDSTSFYNLTVEYPLDKRDKDKIMQAYAMERFNAKKEEWKTGGEVHVNELKITTAFPDRANIKYSYAIEFEGFQSKKPNIHSYLFTNYEYTGGANGNTTVHTFAFTVDAKKLDIQEILNFDQDIELTKLLAETALSDTTLFFKDFVYDGLGLSYLKSDGKTLDHNKCNCDGFFFGSNFQNFVMKDNGLVFYFDKYAIAPGASGVTSVMLTWEQLEPYLQSSFKDLIM